MADEEVELEHIACSRTRPCTCCVAIPVLLKVACMGMVIAGATMVRFSVISNAIVEDSVEPGYAHRPPNLTCNDTIGDTNEGNDICHYSEGLQFSSLCSIIFLPVLGVAALIGFLMNALCSPVGGDGIYGGHYFCFWMHTVFHLSAGITCIAIGDWSVWYSYKNKNMRECSTWLFCKDMEGDVGELCREKDIECALKRYVYRPDLFLVGGILLISCGTLHLVTIPCIMVAMKRLDPRIELPPPLRYCVKSNAVAPRENRSSVGTSLARPPLDNNPT
ncbi:hypothetical protein Ocin01_09210 [Orchesella cincta]|uniref:Uncharacterized protein n=1 Tax=Orchesella cincta TaxID=48709 RepID=A0A1D2MXP9_ORCCI|nr:hypothetical protein Ocin01_09210 [Orchesella cincta]